LWAMMLDTKRTWDDLVRRFALDPAQAQRIFDNHYYQQISSALAGSQEFMAMEKLYELHESGLYDLLVLDTPPTRHALDFLEAPQKMIGFMDEGVLKVLTAPTRMAGRLGFGMLKLSTAMMFAMLQRITGFQVLNDIADFVVSGFRERARRVEEYLRSSRTSFVLVTSPNAQTVDEAIVFFRKLREASMPFGGFIVNRVHADGLEDAVAAEEWEQLRANPGRLTADPVLAARLIDNFGAYQLLAEADAAQIRRLHEACRGSHFWRTVPAFDVDIHDLSGLAQVIESLFDR
jgi:anion-transporting  ArsA/GET3 family ATPase